MSRSADQDLADLAHWHGVHTAYHDLDGQRHPASPDTLRALLRALGVAATSGAEVAQALAEARSDSALPDEIIVTANARWQASVGTSFDWVLLAEDGTQIAEGRAEDSLHLPALAMGYYLLQGPAATTPTRVLARPAMAPDVTSRTGQDRSWGMTGALYGLRSADNGGLGSYADLARAAAALGQQGAQFLGINPVHALGWSVQDIISPYSPTHRGYFNTDHVALPGLGPTPADGLIDYAAFRARHKPALEAAYIRQKDSAAFQAWRDAADDDLKTFAQFEALGETRSHDFRDWPETLRAPGPAAIKAAGARADFHAWLQWQAETQIAAAQASARAAGMSLGLYLDLAVGPRPDGAEVWMNGATIARGVTIGAPPDQLSPEGQSWALAAHAPGPLAAAFYAPFRKMLARLMRHCGLLRIDHALGLARSFWLPDDGSPGGYVSMPFQSLLAVIAIEATRAGCVVIGEDLGLVPEGFRATMNDAGLYSYAVWQFETRHDGTILPASAMPTRSLACFGTHDTPTIAGFWHGADIEWWQRVGWISEGERIRRHGFRARQRHSLRAACDLPPTAPKGQILDAIHAGLAQAPSALVSVQLDDALGVTQAQNLPGTIDEHPNWRRRLPVPVEEFSKNEALRHVTGVMQSHRPPLPAPREKDIAS
ncbi:4-alpha-glucanotransferase [Fluviibacterium sp. DFM31]|uniref:4-alpha-glucanotransferase n=1 Tax=Meridianimarinicoccus marinus TaxID=3231483 RepID=A0ABV3LA91_9RHOB